MKCALNKQSGIIMRLTKTVMNLPLTQSLTLQFASQSQPTLTL